MYKLSVKAIFPLADDTWRGKTLCDLHEFSSVYFRVFVFLVFCLVCVIGVLVLSYRKFQISLVQLLFDKGDEFYLTHRWKIFSCQG